MENTNEISNKEFADKYINLHYERLFGKFRSLFKQLEREWICPLDILNDTCISLYYLKPCKSYQEFEGIANKKFKICTIEINRVRCKKKEDEEE